MELWDHWRDEINFQKRTENQQHQFAVIEASEGFMITALMLISGLITDRIGGAGCYQS